MKWKSRHFLSMNCIWEKTCPLSLRIPQDRSINTPCTEYTEQFRYVSSEPATCRMSHGSIVVFYHNRVKSSTAT